MWAHPTVESGGGALGWPTPTALDRPRTPETMAKSAVFRKRNANQNTVPLYLGEVAQNWATPTATERSGINPNTGQGAGLNLGAKNWGTPQARDHKDGSNPSEAVPTNSLLGRQAPRMPLGGSESSESGQTSPQPWSTPKADHSYRQGRVAPSEGHGHGRTLGGDIVGWTGQKQTTRRLNPRFVEWLMGVPIGWASLKPLEMESYRQWWQSF